MLEIHNFWGPGLWTHVTAEGQILDHTTHGPAVPFVEGDLTDRSCCVNLSLICPFSFPALGECRFISIAAGPLPLFLSLTSRPGACLGVTPLQKASKMLPVAAMPPLLCGRWAGFGPFAVWGPFCSVCSVPCRGGVSGCLLE